jgi:hypothetical protein
MSKDKLDKLAQTLEDGLPNTGAKRAHEYYVQEIRRDLAASRKLFEERIGRRQYSSTHPVGPREMSFEMGSCDIEAAVVGRTNENTDGLLIANRQLRRIDGRTSEIADVSWDIANELRLVREGTDVLPEIDAKLGEIDEMVYRNLVATASGTALMLYEAGQLRAAAEETNEWLEDISESVDAISGQVEDLTSEVVDGFNVTNENLGRIQEDIVEGFEAMDENLDRINDNIVSGHRSIVLTVAQSAAAIKKAIDHGFVALSEEVGAIRLEQRHAVTAVALAFQNFNAEQDRRHGELVSAITTVAENKNGLEADEKYKFALDQFNIGNYRGAIQELDGALLAQSTHLPSLILFGKIAFLRVEWRNAKDSYYNASEIAFRNKDGAAYEVAILALAHIETLVGNGEQGKTIIKNAVERWRGEESFKIVNGRRLKVRRPLRSILPNLFREYGKILDAEKLTES